MPIEPNTYSLKELDEKMGVVKGTAFRGFKAVRSRLVEGQDFFYCSLEEQAEVVETLKQQKRVYGSTVNALLFSKQAAELVCAAMLTITSPR